MPAFEDGTDVHFKVNTALEAVSHKARPDDIKAILDYLIRLFVCVRFVRNLFIRLRPLHWQFQPSGK